MHWPFVSYARFEMLQERLRDVRDELDQVKHEHRRITDEINFRSSGFHLYPEFEKPAVVAAESVATKPTEIADPVQEAINAGGPLSAVRRRMEVAQAVDLAAKAARIDETRLAQARELAINRMEGVLRATTPEQKAASA